jgi:hypothetical protein
LRAEGAKRINRTEVMIWEERLFNHRARLEERSIATVGRLYDFSIEIVETKLAQKRGLAVGPACH